MNTQKLNELSAKAMGWTKEYDRDMELHFYQRSDGKFAMMCAGWHPSECADDALVLLDRVCGTEWWQLAKSDAGEGYTCDSGAIKAPYSRYAETPALAMLFCALRIAGIHESEIEDALK